MRNSVVKTYLKTNGAFLEVIGTSDNIVVNEYKSKFSLIKTYFALIKFLITSKQKVVTDEKSKISSSVEILKNYYDEQSFSKIEKDIHKQFSSKKSDLPNYFG